QLRRRHRVRARAPQGRPDDLRRPAGLRARTRHGDPRVHARLHGRRSGRPRRRRGVRQCAAGAVRPGRDALQADRRHPDLLEPLGGAIAQVDENETALGRRNVEWCYHALSMWMEPDEETADRHVAWAKELTAAMKPHTTAGVYLNFTNEDDEDRVRSTYGP